MNKLIILIMVLFGMISCSNKQEGKIEIKKKNILVAYYSWGGNTKAVGDYIAQKLGADVHQIQTVKPYPTDYDSCVAVVGKQGKAYEPELNPTLLDITDYDIIFVGTPCWWSNISNPLRSFLHQHSFKGKTVIPFMTNGTSGKKLQDVKKLCPDANVLDGFSIYNRYQVDTKTNTPDNMGNWKEEVDNWLNKIATR